MKDFYKGELTMKKILSIILVCMMLLSVCMLPISAADVTPSSTGKTATNVVGKIMTVDGEMGPDEGWGEAVAILNKWRKVAADEQVVKERGRVYASYDESYVYFFVEIASEILNKDTGYKMTNWTCTVKADFGDGIGVQEVGVSGAKEDTGFNNTSKATNIKNQEWTTNASKEDVVFYCKKDETHKVEWKFPIPEAAKTALKEGDFELKVSVYQGIGTGGVFLSDTVETQDDLTTVRNYSISVTLPQFVEDSKIQNVTGKTVTVDGAMGEEEAWGVLPFMTLNATTADGKTSSGNVTKNLSTVRYSVDSENIYAYFETKNKTSERLYMQFAFDGKTSGASGKGSFLVAELDLTAAAANAISSLKYGDGLSYAAGDAMFDGAKAAVKHAEDKIGVEICIPLPDGVVEKRLDGNVMLKVGVYEKFSASADGGYIRGGEYDAFNPSIEIVLEKDTGALTAVLDKWIEQSKTEANHENLAGLSVTVFGDSYFTGGGLDTEFTWASLLAKKYGWTLENCGEDGDMVSEYQGIDDMPMLKRYRKLPNNSPDLVIVTGGYYDWKNNVPLGESGSKDTNTYIGALNTLIDGLKMKYKETAIVFVTPWNYMGTNSLSLTYSEYAEAMAAACEAKGVYCYKAHDSAVSGIDMQNAEFRASYALTADDSYHLNLEGMKLAMPKAETFLNESVTAWLASYDPDANKPGDGDDEEDTSSAADTNSETKDPAADTAKTEKKGCGSAIGASAIALVACVAFAAALPSRKRED